MLSDAAKTPAQCFTGRAIVSTGHSFTWIFTATIDRSQRDSERRIGLSLVSLYTEPVQTPVACSRMSRSQVLPEPGNVHSIGGKLVCPALS